jgi:hypothetical protein
MTIDSSSYKESLQRSLIFTDLFIFGAVPVIPVVSFPISQYGVVTLKCWGRTSSIDRLFLKNRTNSG